MITFVTHNISFLGAHEFTALNNSLSQCPSLADATIGICVFGRVQYTVYTCFQMRKLKLSYQPYGKKEMKQALPFAESIIKVHLSKMANENAGKPRSTDGDE